MSKRIFGVRTAMSFLAGIILLIAFTVLTVSGAYGVITEQQKTPFKILNAVASGQPYDIIVLFDDTIIKSKADAMRRDIGVYHDTPEILKMKESEYASLKRKVTGFLPAGEQQSIKEYSHLPMTFMRVMSIESLTKLLNMPEVVRVYENRIRYPVFSSSIPFINKPQVAALNMKGAETAIVVLDTGLKYSNSAFGICSGANKPADCCPGGDCNTAPPFAPRDCNVACVHNFAPNDGQPDADGYGTNAASIVVGVAPDTKVIGLDVFTDAGAYDSDIIAAINWSIAKKAAYNIVAINMNFGDGIKYTSQCPDDSLASSISSARAAGILSVIAAGNENYTNGLSSPACVPDAISVGAVYESNIGGVSYSNCTDSTTAADKAACFSNSADYLSILAPGSYMTASGFAMLGTSHAAAYIAGSIAVLRGQNAFPSETINQTAARLTNTEVFVLDQKSGITKPRVNLLSAVSAAEAEFSISGIVLSGTTPLYGVTMTLSGAASATAITNRMGSYSFTGLGNGSYTVTPSKAGFVFGPQYKSITIENSNMPDINFEATGSGGCTYTISPKSQSFTTGGGSGSVAVAAGAGCAWTAVSNAAWITITGGSSGSGNGTVNYYVSSNTGSARTGTMTIAKQTFSVSQSGTGGSLLPDLIVTSVLAPRGWDNNVQGTVTVAIKNIGSNAAGAFKVKGYFSVDQIPNNGGTPKDSLLFTWYVTGGLAAGQTRSRTFTCSFSGFPIHASYYVVVKVDSDNQVSESNESNNVKTYLVNVSR